MVVLIVKVEPIAGDVVLGVAVIEIAGVGSPRMILAAIATGKPNDGALQLIALSRRTPGGGLSMIRYSTLSMLDCEAQAPHCPTASGVQLAPGSAHRSTSYVTACDAPALASGSSQVSTATTRLVPRGTLMSKKPQDLSVIVIHAQWPLQPLGSSRAQCD